jgi:hypothetical protein
MATSVTAPVNRPWAARPANRTVPAYQAPKEDPADVYRRALQDMQGITSGTETATGGLRAGMQQARSDREAGKKENPKPARYGPIDGMKALVAPFGGFVSGALGGSWEGFDKSWMGEDYTPYWTPEWDRDGFDSPFANGGGTNNPVAAPTVTVPGSGNVGSGNARSQDYTNELHRIAMGQIDMGGASAGISALDGERERVSVEFDDMLARLDGMYQLAETPQEKAMVEFALSDIQDQHRAAIASIDQVYDEVDATVGGYVSSTAERAAGVGDVVTGEYDRIAAQAIAQEQMAREMLGAQGGEAFAGAGQGDAALAMMAQGTQNLGNVDRQYEQTMADMSAEDAAWIQQQLGGQRAANTAESGRLQADLRSGAIRDHEKMVAARVAQERMARASAEQQLMMQRESSMQQLAQQQASMREVGTVSPGDRMQAIALMNEMGGQQGAYLPPVQLPTDGMLSDGGGGSVDALDTAVRNFADQVRSDRSRFEEFALQFVDAELSKYPANTPAYAAHEQMLYDTIVKPYRQAVNGG